MPVTEVFCHGMSTKENIVNPLNAHIMTIVNSFTIYAKLGSA